MKNFYQQFSSKSDLFTLSANNLFSVLFLTDFTTIAGNSYSVGTINDIDLIIKSIELPNIVVGKGDDLEINEDYVTYMSPSNSILKPESNSFTITVYNTLESPIETIFYPWLEKSTQSVNSTIYPFNRSVVDVILYKNNILYDFGEQDIKFIYELTGVYPVHIDTPTFDHETQGYTRTIGFKFNNIRLKYINKESL